MTGFEMLGAVGGLAAGGLATYVGLVVRPLEKDLDAAGKRIDALHADKKDLEKRMNELERNALTRDELADIRQEFNATVEKLATRIQGSIEKLSERVDHALDRVAKVEGAR